MPASRAGLLPEVEDRRQSVRAFLRDVVVEAELGPGHRLMAEIRP